MLPGGIHRREIVTIRVTNLSGRLAMPWWSKVCVKVFQ